MEHGKSTSGNFALGLVCFLLAAMAAACMLLTALLVWFSEVMGSLALAALIIGGAFVIIAVLLYYCTLHRALARIRSQLDTVYYVARLAKNGYEWISEKIQLWLHFFGIGKK